MIQFVLLASLFLPQTATAPAAAKGQVLFWPGGVSPEGIDHKDIFANHGLQVSHRDKSGDVEVHLTKADVMVIQSGTATLLYGGEGVGMHSSAENEMLGTTIKGGQTRRAKPGDVIHVPTGVPHQWILAPGEKIQYFVVKIVDPPQK